MTSKEYVIWLKGFVEACHEYAPTPKQWDALKDKLQEVNDSFGTSSPGFAITTTPGYGSITYTPSTSTTYGYPSGSAWSYTNNKPHNED